MTSQQAENKLRHGRTGRWISGDSAHAGVSEYWIVDPDDRKIMVLVLQNGTCQTHGEFTIGDEATGLLIPDLKIDVAEIMKLGDSAG